VKRIVIIILTFAYLSGICSPFYTYVGYLINKDYIAANLCENKDKPEMNCEGKCQLTVQLAKDVEQKQDNKAPQSGNRELNPHTIASFNFTPYIGVISVFAENRSQQQFADMYIAAPESPPRLFV